MTKKQKTIKRACELLNQMEEDERKAKQDYDELINLIPEYAGKLNVILGDEIIHDVELGKIKDKLRCR